ncbi:MAG: SEC-C metal-binding domain-containing protein [Proteobacteria bacterium]|nr:SEC-C metal-binding domain-containing protein [Pseudomonadota bacterium]
MPTNKPVRRVDYSDVIYKTRREKYRAVIREIEEMHAMGRPVLVGTVSVEVSELISRMLPKKIKHYVLNAKRHKEEAEIVANAGQAGAVTIATNMAGRGTDIKLGPGVVKCKEQCCVVCEFECSFCPDSEKRGMKMAECFKKVPCGLHIVGTERHEARRIDRQLRGRSGRQGDPGSSRFFLSLEDDLLRIFGSERISSVMDKLGIQEDEPIEHNLITRAIENAQKKVEGHNFDIRKHLLEYDDVMNKQREVIYEQRSKVLQGGNLKEGIEEIVEEMVDTIVSSYAEEKSHPEDWDITGLKNAVFKQFSFPLQLNAQDLESLTRDSLKEMLLTRAREIYQRKEVEFGEETLRQIEKMVYLQVIDNLWKEHLLGMDHLKEGIGLRGYGQRDPLQEYKKEGYDMFLELVENMKKETVEKLYMVQLAREEMMVPTPAFRPQQFILSRGEEAEPSKPQTVVREGKKVGRNEPCPCGSGKKYKKCCGR